MESYERLLEFINNNGLTLVTSGGWFILFEGVQVRVAYQRIGERQVFWIGLFS